MERETRLELATFSLEGWSSTNWATPAYHQMIFSETGLGTTKFLQSAVKNRAGRSHVVLFDPDLQPKSPTLNSPFEWWWGEDLNLRRLRRQIYSLFPLTTREPHRFVWTWGIRVMTNAARPYSISKKMEPAEGFEPPTHWLQISSSAGWATLAHFPYFQVYKLYSVKLFKDLLSKIRNNTLYLHFLH